MKTAKLEQLNKLFVGRELRMKELKEKIGELEGRGTRKKMKGARRKRKNEGR